MLINDNNITIAKIQKFSILKLSYFQYSSRDIT